MDFDKLQAALNDPEVSDLFSDRDECLKGITQAEGNLAHLREQLGEIENKINEKVGGAKPETSGTRAKQKCKPCFEQLHIESYDHDKRGHDEWLKLNRPRLVAEGVIKEAA